MFSPESRIISRRGVVAEDQIGLHQTLQETRITKAPHRDIGFESYLLSHGDLHQWWNILRWADRKRWRSYPKETSARSRHADRRENIEEASSPLW